jgi:exodeoxyribonuclease-3
VRLVLANVNGIRAALRRGGLGWLAAADADIITVQEVRATEDQLAKTLAEGGLGDYHWALAAHPQLGRAGVAVLSREPIDSVVDTLGPGIDDAGRWIEVATGGLRVVSAYVHTGAEEDPPRQAVKYAFLDGMERRLAQLPDPAVVTGDFNVAHHEADLKNWKGNLKKAGFLPQERAYFDRWLAAGWVDLGRAFGGDGPGPYTWWSWRGKAFDTDTGWRIDYALATAGLAARVRDVRIGRAASYAERWSDHAPVAVDWS